ncbi:MAG: site-specific DNA-methyltransferase [Candidatus Edwardsbacteria bacterium]|nr:site-specific DNA-methyltransferase [Candidatus Edwardsbacteria bacterium]
MPTLSWIGKKAVENHHREVPFHLLKELPELSVGDPGSGNLLVEGDNLLALKALLPYYAGQVKCIFIDPPYNTGEEKWKYNDNVNSPEIKDWLGDVVGGEAEDLTRHDKWLCMMYPRLTLLRLLLKEDGVIFICIDDNELSNLILLADSIFKEQNRLAVLVWEKGKKGDSTFFSKTHEYILVYAKSKSTLVSLKTKWKRHKQGVDKVLAYYSSLKEIHGNHHDIIHIEMMKWYKSLKKGDPAKAHKHYKWSDERNLYFAADLSGPDDGRKNRPRYDIPHPLTGKSCKKPSTGWRWEEPTTKEEWAEMLSYVHFGPDETTIPCRKTYLYEVNQEPFPSVFYKDGRAATLLLENIIGKNKFEYPKDPEIIAELINMTTKSKDIVFDSFAGSGSTGHAVLKLNNEIPDSERKFVLIELDNEIARNVTRKRLGNIINREATITQRGMGFRYSILGDSLFDEKGDIRNTVRFADLARHVYFTETGEPIHKQAKLNNPLIGVCRDVGVYLLYNGILKDKTPDGGNVLTTAVLSHLPKHKGPKVIYGTACRLGANRLRQEKITFKQLPYKIRVDAL